jgi:hypothetical protein
MHFFYHGEEEQMISLGEGGARRGLNSLIILGAWTLWKHRNRCVFDGVAPCLAATLTQAGEERCMWELAGARGISSLTAPLTVS